MFVRRSKYKALEEKLSTLQHGCISQTQIIQSQEQTIKELVDIIRAHDQLIYSMSQCSDWSTMRPYFIELQRGQCSRQRAESNRITNIMREELLYVYAKP